MNEKKSKYVRAISSANNIHCANKHLISSECLDFTHHSNTSERKLEIHQIASSLNCIQSNFYEKYRNKMKNTKIINDWQFKVKVAHGFGCHC